MKDQVQALKTAGISAEFLNSSLTPAEYNRTKEQILRGTVKLLYMAPERFNGPDSRIFDFISGIKIPLVVIDESHCVSQWGHDFRPSYLGIADFVKQIKPRPVCAAFTATATIRVRENIRELLKLGKDAFVITTGFNRPNLYFETRKPEDKKSALISYIEKQRMVSGIVYCATRRTVEEVHALLVRRGYSATRYHAGLDDDERKKNQDDFLHDRKNIMIATNAFGMGIDKSNVSYVIHFNMPKNIESYYQEAGRAGRDGEKADCILFYSGQDVRINEFLITKGNEDEAADPEREAHNLELLKQMTFYSTGIGCLRKRLLSYFGEESPSFCGNCSNCLTEYEKTDITQDAKKILSCVFMLRQRNRSFGKTMIINILKGSSGEKIRAANLESIGAWGVMKETDTHRIRTILDFLIAEGLLFVSGDEYPVINLGNAVEFMKNNNQLFMMLPREQSAKPASVRRSSGESSEIKSPEKQTNNADDNLLFSKLKELRAEFSRKEGYPAFVIFSDASLRDMCRRKPDSLVRFSSVNGVGSVKLEKYGEAFVELIREYLKNY